MKTKILKSCSFPLQSSHLHNVNRPKSMFSVSAFSDPLHFIIVCAVKS